MGHKHNYIRVKRKGSGHLKVSIEADDDTIGDTKVKLYWIRKEDSDPNDPDEPFTFDPKTPLIFPTPSPFTIIDHTAKKVTVSYAGAAGSSKTWECKINVVDGKKAGPGGITSDGSATIKNH